MVKFFACSLVGLIFLNSCKTRQNKASDIRKNNSSDIEENDKKTAQSDKSLNLFLVDDNLVIASDEELDKLKQSEKARLDLNQVFSKQLGYDQGQQLSLTQAEPTEVTVQRVNFESLFSVFNTDKYKKVIVSGYNTLTPDEVQRIINSQNLAPEATVIAEFEGNTVADKISDLKPKSGVTLEVEYKITTNTTIEWIADNIKKMHVSTLTFSALGSDNDFNKMLKTIEYALENKNITRLDLKNFGLKDDDVAKIASMLENNTSIKNLDLSSNQITSTGAEKIASMLQKNKSINTLFLIGNSIETKGAISLLNSLKQNTSMKLFSLQDNKISDIDGPNIHGENEFSKALEDVIKTNKNLTFLSIAGNNLSDSTGSAILRTINQNTSLHQIDVSRTKFLFDTYTSLKQTSKVINSPATIRWHIK